MHTLPLTKHALSQLVKSQQRPLFSISSLSLHICRILVGTHTTICFNLDTRTFTGSTRLLFNYCWNLSLVCLVVIYQTNGHICEMVFINLNNFSYPLMYDCYIWRFTSILMRQKGPSCKTPELFFNHELLIR